MNERKWFREFDYPGVEEISDLLDWYPFSDSFLAIWGDCTKPLPVPAPSQFDNATFLDLDTNLLWPMFEEYEPRLETETDDEADESPEDTFRF